MTTAHDVCNQADISYRQLDFWTRAGYLIADDRSPWERQGYPREYSRRELEVAKVMARLTRAGITPKVAHLAARQIIADGEARIGDVTVTLAPDCRLHTTLGDAS